MVYLENIDDFNLKISQGGSVSQIRPKITLEARKDETGRMWVENVYSNEAVIISKSVGEVSYDGTVYGSADDLVDALNESLGSKLNYPVAVAKDSLGNIIAPSEYNINGIDYVAHIFNASGSLEVTRAGDIDYLIVAGGGSGGAYGGGGGGGTLEGKARLAIGTFAVTVGDGGVAVSTNTNGNNGGDSVFNGKTAKGGGGGASGNDNGDAKIGGSGGGGGMAQVQYSGNCIDGAIGTEGQGNNGGDGTQQDSSLGHMASGGGGGAGSVGENGLYAEDGTSKSGDGGDGLASSISGTENKYAGGGGGGHYQGRVGIGKDGGGSGNGIDATANTGGGGGGARPASISGAGGSGIVIVRYRKKITPFNIFLVAGQSNTDGRVATTDVNTPDYLTDNIVDNVKVWNGISLVDYDLTDIGQSGNGSSWVSADSSGKYSFAHVALKKVAETIDNVIVCQVTQGSSPLAAVSNAKGSWNYDYEAIPVGTPKLLESLENRFAALQSYLNSINRSYVVRGIFFHQGEWDDDSKFNEEDEYAVNFSQLVLKVRLFTNKPSLPIIYGTVPAASSANSLIIKNAHLDFATNDSNAYCRDNDNLTLFDSYHLDADSCNTFGEWVAMQYLNNYT